MAAHDPNPPARLDREHGVSFSGQPISYPATVPGEVEVRRDLPAVPEYDQSPQWVLVGIDLGNQVGVLASSSLTTAQLTRKRDMVMKKSPWGTMRVEETHCALVTQFTDFTFIRGDSFIDVMRTVAEVWHP
jgi:hypothetical protein